MIQPRIDSPSLADRLRTRIRDAGPMRFDAFMEAALYDRDGGFFQRTPVGERGHFVTAPHVSPAFGALVARQVEELWTLLERPDPFVVVEVGAGDGTLASQILDFLPDPPRRALDYVAVERGAAGRAAMGTLDVTVVESIDDIPTRAAGCVIANEVLDNMAVRWVARGAEGAEELHVGHEGGAFSLVSLPAAGGEIDEWLDGVEVGHRRLVPVKAMAFASGAPRLFERGYLWVADYGFADGTWAEAPHAYREHREEEDVLADPGSRDITAGVDFAAVAEAARTAGLTVWGPVSQRGALMTLGFRALEDDALLRQSEAQRDRRGLEAARIYSARQRAALLVEPGGLGEFLVLAAGWGVRVPPASVRQVG